MTMTKTENITRWKINVFNAIKELSDIEVQKLSWNGKHPLMVSSLDEVINTLYDDFKFEDYLEYLKRKGLENTSLYSKMAELNKSVNAFLKEGQGNEVLEDPEWLKITQLANGVIEEWITSAQLSILENK